jgi:hypothetical protein
MRSSLRRATVPLIACLGVLAIAAIQPQAAGAREPDRTCGVEPGDGAFNYVEVWNVPCRTARKISRKADRKFCGDQGQRCDAPKGEFDSGRVGVRRWTCKMRVGYESYRARCFKGADHDPRFVHRAGA